MPRCPTCRAPVRPKEENPFFPFCSERCRSIDLGKWFTGEYRVPGPPAAPAEPELPAGRDDDEQ